MKRVSFEVAQVLKDAGYPQDKNNGTMVYPTIGEFRGVLSGFNDAAPKRDELSINAPYYLEVWLWLWREKRSWLEVRHLGGDWFKCFATESDPENAIIGAINYLAENNLII